MSENKKTGGILDHSDRPKIECETPQDEHTVDLDLLGDDFGLGPIERVDPAQPQRTTVDSLLLAGQLPPRLPHPEAHGGVDLTGWITPAPRGPAQRRGQPDITPLRDWLRSKKDKENERQIADYLALASHVVSRMQPNGLFRHSINTEFSPSSTAKARADLARLMKPEYGPSGFVVVSLTSLFPHHPLVDNGDYRRIIDHGLQAIAMPLVGFMRMPEYADTRDDKDLVFYLRSTLADYDLHAPIAYKCSLVDLLLVSAVAALHASPDFETYKNALTHCANGAVPLGLLRRDLKTLLILIA